MRLINLEDVASFRPEVILLTNAYPFGQGELFIHNEISYLAASFARVLIISGTASEDKLPDLPENVAILISQPYDNFTVYNRTFPLLLCELRRSLSQWRYWRGIIGYFRMMVRYAAFIERVVRHIKGPVLIYSYWLNAFSLGALLAKREDVKVVARAHRYDLYQTDRIQPFQSYALNHLDAVYPISKDGQDYLLHTYPHSAAKIKHFNLGTHNPSRFLSPSPKSEQHHIVSCSSVIPRKRVLAIAAALIRCAEQNPSLELEWTHFGDGSDYPKLYQFCQLKKTLNLHIHLPGFLPNEEILQFYQRTPIRLLINASSSEGIPVSMMEAQSYGIPILATDVGGGKEILLAGTGTLIPPEFTIAELSDAISSLLFEQQDRKIIQQAWDTNFNAEINYPRFVTELRSLMANETI
jgi:colanic acid/amylovoran biosynthesis glycosyltransferase